MNKAIVSAPFALLICVGASQSGQPADLHDAAMIRFERCCANTKIVI